MYLSQEAHITQLANRMKVRPDNTTDTPLQPNWYVDHDKEIQEMTEKDKEYVVNFPYRSVIGVLLFIAICTRPDISYAVGYLSRYLVQPVKSVCHASLRVIRYLVNTKAMRLTLGGTRQPLTFAYSDTDWAQCRETRRSTMGIFVYFGQGCVIWMSVRQSRVTNSSAEAEYLALAPCASEIIWIRSMLHEMGIRFQNATTIFCDNEAAKAIAEDPVFHKRTKSIGIKAHFIRETNDAGVTMVKWMASSLNIADMGTKPLQKASFQSLRNILLNGDGPPTLDDKV